MNTIVMKSKFTRAFIYYYIELRYKLSFSLLRLFFTLLKYLIFPTKSQRNNYSILTDPHILLRISLGIRDPQFKKPRYKTDLALVM